MKSVAFATWVVLLGAPASALAQDSSGSSLFADSCAGLTGTDQSDCLPEEQGSGQSGLSVTPFGGPTFGSTTSTSLGSSTFGSSASVPDSLGTPAIGSGSLSGSQGTADPISLQPTQSSPVGTTPSVTSPSTTLTFPSTSPAGSQGATGTGTSIGEPGTLTGNGAPGTAGGAEDMSGSDLDDPLLDPFE